jgi:drug/metabolite transporter (DMT)-like permease
MINNSKIATSPIGIVLMVFSATSTAFGQFFWKLSEASLNIEMVSGFLLYIIGACLMIVAFKFGELSVLHPLLSIGYVISIILGVFLLNETINTMTILGLLCIITGAVVIGSPND